jgi:nitrite reductase/ring-hydroxylating ferredoxin subunit/uncharacterized membrane protein
MLLFRGLAILQREMRIHTGCKSPEVPMRSRAHIKSHPIHPMLIALPIGLWIGSFVFDCLAVLRNDASLAAAGFYSAIAGCVGAALAAIPGAIDLFSVVPERSSARQRGYIHGALNVLVLGMFIVMAARRGAAMPDRLSLLLSAIGVAMLGISGWLGGTLVYRNQIGVDHRYANAGKYRERELRGWDQPACNQSELSDGQMILARVGSQKIVVGRCSDGVVAFSNMCTHRGGPLSDGVLIGCTVQCPWHGSQFNVHTGRVVAGPAQQAIDAFNVEVRNGEVFVSPNVRRIAPATPAAPPDTERVA